MIKKMIRQEKGQSTLEVTLILMLVVVTTIGIMQLVGVNVASVYCQVIAVLGIHPASCPASDGVLYSDDFNDGDFDGWEVNQGNDWRIEDDELCAGPGQHHRIFARGSKGEDFTVSFDGTLKSGRGFGVFFRTSNDELNGYIFQYDEGYGSPGAFIYRKWINGHEMSPFRPYNSAPAGYEWYNVKRHFEVSIQGNSFETKIDGEVVATAVDNAVPPEPYYESGLIGFRTWGSEACFDNVIVTTQ